MWWVGALMAIPAGLAWLELRIRRRRPVEPALLEGAKRLGGRVRRPWVSPEPPAIVIPEGLDEISIQRLGHRGRWLFLIRHRHSEPLPLVGRICSPPQRALEGWVQGMAPLTWALKGPHAPDVSLETDEPALMRWLMSHAGLRRALGELESVWGAPWELRCGLDVVEIRLMPGEANSAGIATLVGPLLPAVRLLAQALYDLSGELAEDAAEGLHHTRALGLECGRCDLRPVPGERALMTRCGRGGCPAKG